VAPPWIPIGGERPRVLGKHRANSGDRVSHRGDLRRQHADGTPDEMPVYGSLFRSLWADEPVTIRCGNLARYIESIRAK